MMSNDSNEEKRLIGTKRKILDAAQLEFAKYGLAGARVDRIAEESRVNKAMIYYHFKSKESLYQEVINRLFSSVAKHVGKFLANANSPDQFFTQLAYYYDSLTNDFEHYVPILLHELGSGGARIKAGIESTFTGGKITSKIVAFIEQCKAKGQFRDIDSRQATMSFIGMNKFYFLIAPVFNHLWEVKDAKKFKEERPAAVVDLFLNGVLKKDE